MSVNRVSQLHNVQQEALDLFEHLIVLRILLTNFAYNSFIIKILIDSLNKNLINLI